MIRRVLQGIFRVFGIDAYFYRYHKYTDYVCMDRNMLEWYYHNEQERKLYDEAMSRTGMEWSDNFPKLCRHYLLQTLARRVLGARIDGDFAECGCWKGTSSYELATLIGQSGLDKRLHIFDSFEGGLSDKVSADANVRVELSNEEIERERMIFSSTEQGVRNNLSAFPFVAFYAGWIPERFSDVDSEKFCFVHIDVDLYEPTRDSLDFFWQRLQAGGIIVVDDYGYTQFPGARKAVQEFVDANAPAFFLDSPIGGCFLVK